jgi:hypothetical protein
MLVMGLRDLWSIRDDREIYVWVSFLSSPPACSLWPTRAALPYSVIDLDEFRATNQAEQYDPVHNAWTALPGFDQCGGDQVSWLSTNPPPAANRPRPRRQTSARADPRSPTSNSRNPEAVLIPRS